MKNVNPFNGVVPFVFHRVVSDRISSWEDIDKELFERIIKYIGNQGVTFCDNHNKDKKKWLLTFDDGFSSDYEIVFPILQQSDLKATFFLITNRIGQPGYLTWSQIKEMSKYGMCFGSHSLSHRPLIELTQLEVRKEMEDSKQYIEQNIGKLVNAFSFPYGDWTSKHINLASEVGYSYKCLSHHGVIDFRSNIIPRNSINSSMSWPKILKLMEPSLPIKMQWQLEDIVKKSLKGALGNKNYKKIREHFF